MMSNNPLTNNEFVVAALSPNKLQNMTEPERLKSIVLCINEVFKFRGQIPNAEDSIDIAKSLSCKIFSTEYIPTVEEIRTAFEYGVTGEYGEYFGINYVTLWNWIKSYVWCDDRIDTLRRYWSIEQQTQASRQIVAKSEETIQAEERLAVLQSIKNLWNDLRNHKPNGLTYRQQQDFYKLLRKEHIMPKPEQYEIDSAMDKARIERHAQIHKPNKSLKDIINNALEGDATEEQRIHRIALSFLLEDFLCSLEEFPEIK